MDVRVREAGGAVVTEDLVLLGKSSPCLRAGLHFAPVAPRVSKGTNGEKMAIVKERHSTRLFSGDHSDPPSCHLRMAARVCVWHTPLKLDRLAPVGEVSAHQPFSMSHPGLA